MTIQNCLDNIKFSIREGIEFYYFGEGCIADYYGSSIAYLDEVDIKIILLLKKGLSTFEIDSYFNNMIDNKDCIITKIQNLYKKGVLVRTNCGFEKELIFHGIKGCYFPKEIAIELTNTCNYKCPFCYKNAQVKGEFISDETIYKIDDTIRNNVRHILLTGGEPTIHPNYLEYIELFSTYADVHMISNGSVLFNHNPEVLRKLQRIQFSIYGCDDKEYKKMTGISDGFTRLCKSIEFAKQNGINISAGVTLCDNTIDHIESFVKIALELGFDTLRIGTADVFGRGKKLFDSNGEYEEQRDKVYDILLELKRKYRKDIYFELPNIYVKHVVDHSDINENVFRNSLCCGCGSEYLAISEKGEIRPCQMLPESWFSIGAENALIEHIKGDFHIKQLHRSAEKYYSDNDFYALNISPCQALEQLTKEKERNNHVSE